MASPKKCHDIRTTDIIGPPTIRVKVKISRNQDVDVLFSGTVYVGNLVLTIVVNPREKSQKPRGCGRSSGNDARARHDDGSLRDDAAEIRYSAIITFSTISTGKTNRLRLSFEPFVVGKKKRKNLITIIIIIKTPEKVCTEKCLESFGKKKNEKMEKCNTYAATRI